MQFCQLPLATQMLLDPNTALSAAVLGEWDAACYACLHGVSAEDVASPLSSSLAQPPTHNAARRGPKKLVDTHDFFALSDALDTLTDELRASTGKGFSSAYPSAGESSVSTEKGRGGTTTTTTTAASAPAAAAAAPGASPRFRVDDFDTRKDAAQSALQQTAVREAAAAFHRREYKAALDKLLHASSLCMSHELTVPLLHNIAVCYYKLEQWGLCQSATQRVMSTDTANVYPSEQRLARVYICQGNSEEAQRLVAAHRDAPEWREEAAAARAFSAYGSYYASHQYVRARESLEAVLAILPCGTLEATKARVLSLDNAVTAAHYAQQKAALYPYSVEMHMAAWELTFHAATSTSDLTAIYADMQQASIGTSDLRFRLLQTHVVHCRDAVDQLASLVQAKRWADVVTVATQTLRAPFVSDGLKGILYHDRARARVQLGASWYEALDDAHRALSYTEKPELRAQLLLLVARSEEALGRWQDAVDHAEESIGLLRTATAEAYVRKLTERRAQERKRAAASQRRAAPPDSTSKQQQQQQQQRSATGSSRDALDVHYDTLSLGKGADATEVRKSYRAMAMKWHPDRWCGATAEEMQTAETRFKAIQDAYEKLMQGLV